ncbi:unnamed protein product [Gadus morhua 'NCC']
MIVYELEVCAVLASGAWKSVFPLCHYNAIHPDVRPPLQSSIVETLIGVGSGAIPVLGEGQITVEINNRQASLLFLVADIAGDEALLGYPFLSQAQARLDFGNQRIVLFVEGVPYFDSTNKTKAQAVRVARTTLLEAGQEYVDTLDTLSDAKWISTLDHAAGYWQVELSPRACKAAAFCTKN